MLIYFSAILNTLRTCGIAFDHSVHFLFSGQKFSGFGIMHQEKSGNPGGRLAAAAAAAQRLTQSSVHFPVLSFSSGLFLRRWRG
jgi:hypothetical protein